MPEVISASRRTDLPAFHGAWFAERLREGTVQVRLPYGNRLQQVSLHRRDVAAFVFWSKDYRPFLPVLSRLEAAGYPSLLHFTITGLPPIIEPGVPATADAVACFHELARRLSPERMLWRFDPILLLPDAGPQTILARFRQLCAALEGATRRCYTSFAVPYAKVRRAFRQLREKRGMEIGAPDSATRRELAGHLAEISGGYGISLHACASPELLQDGIATASCIDALLLHRLFPGCWAPVAIQPSRPGCSCSRAIDIGSYSSCGHGCLYCYANESPLAGRQGMRACDPHAACLGPAHPDSAPDSPGAPDSSAQTGGQLPLFGGFEAEEGGDPGQLGQGQDHDGQ